MNFSFLHLFPVLFILIFSSCQTGRKSTKDVPVKVTLEKESYGYQLYLNGTPYFVKGAGLGNRDPASVYEHGGNTIRTWHTGHDLSDGLQLLDTAHKYGLMVVMGLDIARERHGFNYSDTDAVKAQLEYAKGEVMKYKDHPALLAWGIGNELNLRYSNTKVWDAVNEISEMIKELDTNHLTTTMLAGSDPDVVRAVAEQCPSLDYLSFQHYGSILKLPGSIAESGYEGAYMVTEWGVTGHWEVPQTAWNRPIEENSHVKAMSIKNRYEKVIAADAHHCIGSFIFLWGQKQERTPTWYGLFLQSGEKTESVDVMEYLWTGNWPENRAPQLKDFYINGLTAYDNIYLSVAEEFEAKVVVTDPENDPLTYKWEIMTEVPLTQLSDGGDFEPQQAIIFSRNSNESAMLISTPDNPGEYRLFVYVFDGNHSAATANIPFYVR